MGHRLAPQARTDIDEIAYYVFVKSGSAETADRLIDSLYSRFLLLPNIHTPAVNATISGQVSGCFRWATSWSSIELKATTW